MTEEKSNNLPKMSVGKMAEMLAYSYSKTIEKGLPLSSMPSLMLWGAPGVGKSQGVREIAGKLESSTGKRVVVKDVRLLLFNPIDLRGIPVANAEKSLAVWLKPAIFEMDPSEEVVNILFLDEISSAPQSVQAAAYQITLDRVVGEHKLPPNCIVIAAGNRVSDKSVAYKMPKALANRLLHLEIESDFASWKRWAIEKGINEKVVGFLSFRPNCLLCFDPSKDDLAFPTPRSWEMVSDLLNNVSDDLETMSPFIAGLLGKAAEIEFSTWAKVYRNLPEIEDIFAGKMPKTPKGSDALYALISSMASYAKKHKDDMEGIAHSIVYADSLPPDFSAALLKDYLYLEPDYKKRLMKLAEFRKWLESKGALLNGSI